MAWHELRALSEKKKNKEGLGKKAELGDTQSDDEICLSKKWETFDLVKNQETTRQDEERQEPELEECENRWQRGEKSQIRLEHQAESEHHL